VRDVKALTRGDEEKIAPLDVRAVVRSISLATNEIKHRAQLVCDFADVVPVDANEVRLGQVFLNLLVNAAHVIPVGQLEAHEIRGVARMAADGRVAVEVRDTGVGSWVCHGIVSSLGGEIAVESEVGRGTVVRVLLPPSRQAIAAPEATPAPSAAPARGGRRPRVLVVDDEAPVRRAIERLLRSRYEVVSSPDARDALARLGRGERFDALISDVMMPEMTGIELFGEIARASPELAERVVFVTGAFTSETVEFLRQARNPRVYKPIRRAQLHAALEEVLRDAPEGAARAAPAAASASA
jgi:CheY-like chemotaxis protein